MSILALLILVSLALGVAAWVFFVWTVRSGQYEDPEGPKYRMLEEDDQADPARAGAPGGGAAAARGDVTPGADSPPSAPPPRDPATALRTTASAGPLGPSPSAAKPAGSRGARDVPPSRRNGVHRP